MNKENSANPTKNNITKDRFATRLGVIAATVGSAVGLGNIWRFPYEAGNGGGSAFILCYVFFVVPLALPVLCAEFLLGKETRSNIFGCFKRLSPNGKWYLIGIIGLVSALMIISFYSVVAGWTMEYFVQSLDGTLLELERNEFHENFQAFASNPWRSLLWTWVFLAVTWMVSARGVKGGIEKVSNVLMPIMFVILVAFCVNSLLMPGAGEGLAFLFDFDMSKVTGKVLLSAMGQAFFSMSLGLGCMLTYGSYFKSDTSVVRSAAMTGSLDTLVAILAGVVIFPAVFTYGMSPAAGPTLVFEVFPAIFANLGGGMVWSALFFFMLFVASLTSAISMAEILIAYLCQEWNVRRGRATAIVMVTVLFFATLCAMSANGSSDITLGGYTLSFFEFFNDCSSNVLLPLGGLLIAIYVGWFMDRSLIAHGLTNGSYSLRLVHRVLMFLLRYLAPLFIIIVFLSSLGVI